MTLDRAPLLDEVIDVYVAGHAFGRPTRCRLRVYQGVGGPIAVVTELAENRGFSVTNAAEHLWRALARRLDTLRFTMVEHYGPESYADGRDRETFDVVTVVDGRPRWRPLDAAGLTRLVQG